MMSHEPDSNAENVRFMSFKCPDTAALCKQSGRPSDAQPSTYVVILNQDSENQSTNLLSQSDQHTLGTRPPGLVCKSKSKSRVSLSPNDDLKLNLTNGFDDYDSSCISQKVFQDDSEGAKSDRFGETTKIIRLKIPSSLQKAMQISQKLNAQRLLAETSTNQQSNIKGQVNSTAKSSPLTESGYSSANSSCFSKESFETPSPVPMPSQHQTARQIFNKSAVDLLKGKPSHTSPSVFTPSPISSLSSGLRNVAVFQASPSFSPDQNNGKSSLNLQRTSTPQSGYVVESADGQKFILPVDPQQTKTVSVSKSDSHINIKPLNMTQFMPNSNLNCKPEVKNLKQQNFAMESSGSKLEAQTAPNKNPFCESIGDSQSRLSDSDQLKSTLEISKNPVTSSQQPECTSSFSMITQEKVGDVIIKHDFKNHENVVKVEVAAEDVVDKAADSQESMDSFPNSQESTEKDSLNDSLTNIQWLGGIQLKEDGKPQMPPTQNKKDNAIQWRCLSHSEVLKIAKEYGRAKRPPFSYMTLIQMALNSTEDKRMTLRQICKWIEEIFPYYKCTAKPGWKNSIRHNLSLYSIFEREKSKKHGSYWTIREDCPEKSKVVPSKEKRDASSTLSSCLPVFLPHQSSRTPKLPIPAHYRGNPDSLKRNLQPILPRPHSFNSAMQTFALIPIQSMNQSQGMAGTSGRPMLIQVPTQPPPTLSQDPKKDAENLPMMDKKMDNSKKKVVNIAPKFNSQNIVKQAWLNAQVGSDNECKSDTGTKEETSGDDSGVKRKKQNNGLPKPRIYPRSSPQKKQQSRRKQKLVPKERDLLQDSSDDNEDDDVKQFINKLEQNLPTPLRAILDDSDTEKVTTSTPMKKASGSPELPSPIRGITPLKGVSLLDTSFLDGFKDLDDGRNPFASPNFMLNMKKMSPSLMRSPNTSQFDNLFSGLTPIKGDLDSSNNENLSRILSEFPLDGIESEDEMLTGNLSNMNWSAICQNINSTPNEKNKME